MRPGAPTLDLGNAQTADLLYLEADGPGTAVTEVWLHNGGPEDLGLLRLRCSDLWHTMEV